MGKFTWQKHLEFLDWADWYVSLWMVKCMSHRVLSFMSGLPCPETALPSVLLLRTLSAFENCCYRLLCLKWLGYYSCFKIQQDVKYLVHKDLILSISTRQFYGRGCFTIWGTIRKTELVFCFLLRLKCHLLLSICPLPPLPPKATPAVKSLLIYKVNVIMPQNNVLLENRYVQCLSSRHF